MLAGDGLETADALSALWTSLAKPWDVWGIWDV